MTGPMPHRNLQLEGATNFRDVGGYATRDGRRVRWRRIFRSNHLGNLSASDLAVVGALGLRNVIDFRSEHEAGKAAPCAIRGVARHAMPIEPAIMAQLQDRLAAGTAPAGAITRDLMCSLYQDFVRNHAHQFRALFDQLRADATPLVFHCAAGKDRTGLAAALILTALGVPRDSVFADYLLTNRHWRMGRVDSALPEEAILVLESADESFLAAAFDTIDTEFGGIDAYLHEHMGLDGGRRAELSAVYLER